MNYPEINRKLEILRGYMETLKPYSVMDFADILKNEERILAMERLFQLIVDEAADINSYIAYQVLNKVPESYKSSFGVLVEGNILDQTLIDTISESAKVRNQIVHDYEKLQKKDAVSAIQKFFPVYEQYLDALVKKFIAN